MSEGYVLQSRNVVTCRDKLDDAIWHSLDDLLTRWAAANNLSVSSRDLELLIKELVGVIR